MKNIFKQTKKIFLFAVICFSAIYSFSQNEFLNKEISIKTSEQSFDKMLKALENAANIYFSYTQEIIPYGNNYSLHYKNKRLKDILDELGHKYSFEWEALAGKIIVLKPIQNSNLRAITISGFVSDSLSGEKLSGAIIRIQTKKQYLLTSTNENGFFSISFLPDTALLEVGYLGFKNHTKRYLFTKDAKMNIELQPKIASLPIVFFTGKNENEQQVPDGEIKLRMKKVKDFPQLLGEADIFRVLQMLPGVQSGGEASTGLYVRGGGSDQNLVLLDGVPVYNASHLMGIFSVFNPDIVRDVRLYKGNIPSGFSGRLSSVVDIRTIDGNRNKLSGSGSFGLLTSKFMIEGPIKNDKTTFVLSARRTFADLLAAPFVEPELAFGSKGFAAGYYFYDINAKLHHTFNSRNRVYVTFYNGRDATTLRNSISVKNPINSIKEKDKQNIYWGNTLLSARWNKYLHKKLYANISASFTGYTFGNKATYSYIQKTDTSELENSYEYKYQSDIKDVIFSTDVDYRPTSWLNNRIGISFTSHRFRPGVSSYTNINGTTTNNSRTIRGNEASFYIENQISVNKNTVLNIGANQLIFTVEGRNYAKIQPRISLQHSANNKINFYASYNELQQFLHLLTNPTVGYPMDLWLPSTSKIKPEKSSITSAGIGVKTKIGIVNIEGFYKTFRNILEYKEGANYLVSTTDWENKVVSGIGEAYGFEFMFEKKKGKTTGWVGYTLAWNNRQFNNLNNGEWFPYRYDRRHDVSVTVAHQFSDKFDFGINWVFGTGHAMSLPEQRYLAISQANPFTEVYIYGKRNAYRMPAYHRMDVSVNFRKKHQNFERVWSIGLYNLYNRLNPYYITPGFDNNGTRVLKQVSIFPIIPSINYRFAF